MKEQSKKTVAKKKFFKMVFSRAGIFVILILIQLLVFLGIPYLKEYATFIYSAMSVMEIVVLVYIINTEGNPAAQNDLDAVCDGTSGYRNGILYLCTSAAESRICTEQTCGTSVWRQNLIWIRMRRLQRHSGQANRQMYSCLLSVTSTWISDLPQYGSRIFPSGRG